MRNFPPARRRAFQLVAVVALLGFAVSGAPGEAASQSKNKTGPEKFRATARVGLETAVGDAHLTIAIDRYTPDKDIQAMEQALKAGGSDAFLAALRRAPVAGHLTVGAQTFTIRWARQRATASGRVISLVTDTPVYFVGGGTPDAKPRSGYDVAVVQLNMDSSGIGKGSMAAAARVKPGGADGVEVEDYASEPVKLQSVSLLIS